MTRGWRVKYIPLALACGVSPDTPRAYYSQQMRWCSGSTSLLSNSEFWKSKLNIIQKICFVAGMLYYSTSALGVFLAPLPPILMLCIKPDCVLYFNYLFVLPSVLNSLILFRLWSRQRYNFNCCFVLIIQQYAYAMALKDTVFGIYAAWVPSGDNQAQKGTKKNNKYRNSRLLCAFWTYGTVGAAIGLTAWRIVQGHRWYDFMPLLTIEAYNLFITYRFIWTT